MKKAMILQTALIVLFGGLALLFAVLTVLEALPAPRGLEVKEQLRISCSPITASGDAYVSSVDGMLFNSSDETIEVERIRVTLRGERAGKSVFRTLELDGFTLPPRTSYTVSHQWEDTASYTRMTVAEARVDGEEIVLENATSGIVGGMTVPFLVLTVLFALLLVRSCKIRYYLFEERRLTGA